MSDTSEDQAEYSQPSEQKPGDWITRDELPGEIVLRAVRFRCAVRGHRSVKIILFTTLLDLKKYSLADLSELYYRRWEMELRLRDIKTAMGLELIMRKTPQRRRNHLWVGLTAYNLVRAVMLDAARAYRIHIARISFKTTLHFVCEFEYALLLKQLLRAQVPHRPGRYESRERKKRPKNEYKLQTKPRSPALQKASEA